MPRQRWLSLDTALLMSFRRRGHPFVVRPEEYRCADASLKGVDESPVLRSALVEAENVQHLGRAFEVHGRALSANCHSS